MAAEAADSGKRADAGSCATFQIADEGHTLGNSLLFMLNKDPNVAVAGYSIPHPSETCVMVRVQTTGDIAAVDALRTASENLGHVCDHVQSTFERAVARFERAQGGAKAAGASDSGDVEMVADDDEDEEEEEEDDEDDDNDA